MQPDVVVMDIAMPYLNLEHWEKALGQLQKTGELTPENKIFSKQFNSLLNFMAAIETLSKNNVFTPKVESSPDP